MEEETSKILKISDLIRPALPLTGAYSLTPSRLSRSQPSDQPPKPSKSTFQYPNPNPKIIKPVNHPAILIGTLNLPSHFNKNTYDNANSTIQCSCFQFSDGSATICCDILNFNPEMMGKIIRVLAWNFVPLKGAANFSGYLEIIGWEYLEQVTKSTPFSVALGTNIDSEDNSMAKYSILGVLESVSPLSVVPCSSGRSSSRIVPGNLLGFLIKISVCECKLCRCKDSRKALHDLSEENCKEHCFSHPLIVYFYGSASSWHPLVLRLIGNVVSLWGLKKKVVYVGKEDSQLMYVTTDKAFLHLSKLGKKWISNKNTTKMRRVGEVSSYTGMVTGIYIQGMVVELDQEVLLLLTDHQLLVPHSLRVGAIVTATNVHFVNPKFSWTKILILGACFITSISVESFSPLETGCYMKSHSENHLRKFVESLTFSARLWVLLVVTCFQKKFTGILSEKEILGSKHKEGLAQTYTTSQLPLAMFRFRHGVFMEYCKHGLCACGSEEDCGLLKLVVPISYLVSHCETRWMKMLLDWKSDFNIMGTISHITSVSCCGRSYRKLIKRNFCDEDIYVILLGSLKVSSSSGRLQMVDATGSIDVVIPDIPSTWDFNAIYEVKDFSVIMQGVPHKPVHLDLSLCDSFTCQSIFRGAQLERDAKLSLYLYYKFSDQKPRGDIYSPCIHQKGSLQELEAGKYHLLWVEHKFPMLHELLGDQGVSNRSTVFAEAIILPWDLSFAKKDEIAYVTGPFHQLRDAIKYPSRGNFKEDITIKRCKTDEAASESLNYGLVDAGSAICDLSNSSNCRCSSSEETHGDPIYPLKFPCIISGRSFKGHCRGILHCTDRKAVTISRYKPDGRKVFLEFDSESLHMYQGLRIGAYYIAKHHERDVLCTAKDGSNLNGSIMPVTPKTHLWSLSFSPDQVLENSLSSSISPSSNSFVSNNEVSRDASQQFRSPPLMFNSPETCSDINLFVPADILSYLKADGKARQSHPEKPFTSFEEETNIYTSSGAFITASLLSSMSSHSDLLPEGNLVSFDGNVLAIHDFQHDSFVVDGRSEVFDNIHRGIVSQGTSSICIHVLLGHHTANIIGAQGNCLYPTGFGEGVRATFHRVLVIGVKQYMLTPTSFIVVNSANGVNYECTDGCYFFSTSSLGKHVASLGAFPTLLISELSQSMDFKQIRLRCRVITLHVLVLEKRKAIYPNIRVQPSLPVIDIPLAGFIMDDGSSPCCCWADSERAATLLGLHFEAIPHEAYVGTSRRSQKTVMEKTYESAVIDRLNKILRQHRRVIVKNCGSTFDPTGCDLTFFVGSDKTLTRSDENFLRCLIASACFSTLWTIVGSFMDSTAVYQLEQQLTDLEMTMLPMINLWSCGVDDLDPVSEARQIIEELMN